jgi:hypothetical protein
MNKKLILSGILAAALIFSLAGCGDGAGGGNGDSPNTFTLTGISQAQANAASRDCLIGLFPVDTDDDQIEADVMAIFGGSGSTSYIVAGAENPQPTESSAPYSISGPLQSASSGFSSNWRGAGTYHIWFILIDMGDNVMVYRTKNPVTLTAGGSTSVSAQTDFDQIDFD